MNCSRKDYKSYQQIKAIVLALDVVVNDMNKVYTGVQRDTAEFNKDVPRFQSQLNKIYSLSVSNNVQPQLGCSDVIRERILSFESEKVPD